jgi:HEPN domain-containing protein
MKPTPNEEAKRWLKQAESDFSFLQKIVEGEKYDLACFLSQQVAEKALKSFLFSQGEEIILTHSIFKLCELASQYDPAFQTLKAEIKNLDRYYVEARYPNALEDLTPAEFFDLNDAKEAVQMAEESLQLVKEKLRDLF